MRDARVHCGRSKWTPLQIEVATRARNRSHQAARPCLAPAGVMACVTAYLVAGVFCSLFPPPLPSVDLDVTDAARCFMATRHADYVVVHVPMGTPAVRLRVLLMPRVHKPHASAPHAPELKVLLACLGPCASSWGPQGGRLYAHSPKPAPRH